MRSFRVIALVLMLPVSFFAQGQSASTSGGALTTGRAQEVRATAQSAETGRLETIDFESKLVNAKLPYIVLLPKDYAQTAAQGTRYPALYLLHGLGGNPRQWLGLNLMNAASSHRFIVVMVDGRNGFYTDSASDSKDKFESYIMQELIPDVDRRYRTNASRGGRAIAGLSMGGYGALKFGVKYPEQFAFAGSMSGAVGAATWQKETDLGEQFRQLLVRIFGAADNPVHVGNDLFRLVRELPPERASALPFIYLDCGTEDFLFESNRAMMSLLTERKIPHEYRQLPGSHRREYWTRQLPELFDVAAERLNANVAKSAAAGSAR